MRRMFFAAMVVVGVMLLPGSEALAKSPSGFTLVQSATLVQPGNNSATAVQVTTTGSPFTWGAVELPISPNLRLRQLNTLSTDYKFVEGSCWGGSPRFEAWVTNGTGTHKIFFYIGPAPSFTGCPFGTYTNTGNLATAGSLVDDSQLPGGSVYDSYANAQANYGSYPVTAVYLDADGGWDGDQTVDFDNTQVNAQLFTYEG